MLEELYTLINDNWIITLIVVIGTVWGVSKIAESIRKKKKMEAKKVLTPVAVSAPAQEYTYAEPEQTDSLEDLRRAFGGEAEDEDMDPVSAAQKEIETLNDNIKKQMQEFNAKMKKTQDKLVKEEAQLYTKAQDLIKRANTLKQTKSKLKDTLHKTSV